MARDRVCSSWGALVIAVGQVDAATLATLYMGEVPGALHKVNKATGGTTLVGSHGTGGSATGLTGRASEPGVFYGMQATSGAGSNSRLLRIDIGSGSATPFGLLDEAVLGFPQPFATAIAISPAAPDVAIVAGFNADFDDPHAGDDFIWEVDVATGKALGAAVPTLGIHALTYSPDGSTLYGTVGSSLVKVNPYTGLTGTIGDTGLSDFLEGLAFDPTTGALYAIDAFFTDKLVILDPNDGSVVTTVGPLGLVGPTGLAFEVPIPGDINYDGVVDVADLGLVGGQWSTGGSMPFNADIAPQYVGDGTVDVADLAVVGVNWTSPAGSSLSSEFLVPSPGAGVGVSALVLGVIGWRRRRRAA